MKKDLLKIIKYYGINNQQRKLMEEIFELQEAITKDELGFYNKEHIAEEIADCYVILEQFRHYYIISDDEILENMEFKIDRQIKRMLNEVFEEEYGDDEDE